MVIEQSEVQFRLKSYAWSNERVFLKSHHFIALNFRFWCIVPVADLLNIAELEAPVHSFSMQNDVTWRKLIQA